MKACADPSTDRVSCGRTYCDELLAELERAVKAKQVAKFVIVRESLEAALRPRVRRAASFDLAADLAAQPRYMDGFAD